MEHRHGMRTMVNLSSRVELISGRVMTACIRNVSFGGIFIELPTEGLWNHAPIRLSFRINQGSQTVTHHWRGFITRLAEHGAGAMFESANPKEQAGLLALLKFAERPESPLAMAC